MNLTNANRDERQELTMPEVEEEFRHTVEVWTVGELKKALADIVDDTKLIFSPAEEPGSDLAGPEQVAFSAGQVICIRVPGAACLKLHRSWTAVRAG